MAFYRLKIQNPDFKGIPDITKQRGCLAFFNQFLARLNQLRCLATLINGTTFPGSSKIHSTSPAGSNYVVATKIKPIFFPNVKHMNTGTYLNLSLISKELSNLMLKQLFFIIARMLIAKSRHFLR